MRICQTALAAVASLILCSSCGESMPASTETNSSQIVNSAAVTKDTSYLLPAAGKQKEAESTISFAVTCEEIEEKNPESEDSIIIKACTYGNYKTVLTGSPDYKGRYYWEYKLYKKEGEEYTTISNSELFNQRQRELQEMINQRIKTEHLELLSNAETVECAEMREPIRDFQLNEMGISFEPDQMVFSVEFGLPSACRNVDGTWVSFKLKEIEPYLNK